MQLPIGMSDFRTLIDHRDSDGNPYFFLDKSLLIGEIIDDWGQVLLFTRPRRFGKTLNMSMLHYFFANEVDKKSTDSLFENLKIFKHTKYMAYQGKYPVIYLTLKEVKENKFEPAYATVRGIIAALYAQHRALLSSPELSEDEKTLFQSMLDKKSDDYDLRNSLKTLTRYLYLHYRVKPIVLIDEYDAPIQTAYIYGYYEEMISFMRSFLGGGLKDNPYLEKAVLTGILRVSKESIFSGLNNLMIYSLLDSDYGEYFGFTEAEVEDLLERTNLSQELAGVRQWYNGYQCGDVVVYNPWSIVYYVRYQKFKSYWVNTANNNLIKKLVIHSSSDFKAQFQLLLEDKPLAMSIDEHMVFDELEKNENNIWTLLVMAGYLKAMMISEEDSSPVYCLQIPNREVRGLYRKIIGQWLFGNDNINLFNTFLSDLLSGNIEAFTNHLQTIMLQIVSVHDVTKGEAETFYHGFMLGLVSGLEKAHYQIRSNAESGLGRFDILIAPRALEKLGIIIEIKSLSKDKSEDAREKLKKAATDAILQIQSKCYPAILAQKGLKKCLNIGIAFRGKEFAIAHRFEELN